MVGFLPLDDADGSGHGTQDTLLAKVDKDMDLYIGASDTFDDLFSARLFYKQAAAALGTGSLLCPSLRVFRFQEFALAEMVIGAIGELPLELYFTNGLHRLVQHDSASSTSYLNTLRAYLDNNMSISKTAAALYVHRSTLLERIARIERDLDTDLRNPDERLRLQMLLKAIQVHSQLRGAPSGAK